ncbi:hypothetical protein MILUP08_43089 [Micromonospora lupini str. Lupac 08]|uniref:Uncharacterized protein n=1 Tax=Micromonospora lupini str. Lupac 08 TaxID=1150864 RepID=I0L2Y7_9ACTN|nr:hypothetical protein MILUP08_43089 [Micromonospora lupini str. Lupac 08]
MAAEQIVDGSADATEDVADRARGGRRRRRRRGREGEGQREDDDGRHGSTSNVSTVRHSTALWDGVGDPATPGLGRYPDVMRSPAVVRRPSATVTRRLRGGEARVPREDDRDG